MQNYNTLSKICNADVVWLWTSDRVVLLVKSRSENLSVILRRVRLIRGKMQSDAGVARLPLQWNQRALACAETDNHNQGESETRTNYDHRILAEARDVNLQSQLLRLTRLEHPCEIIANFREFQCCCSLILKEVQTYTVHFKTFKNNFGCLVI